MSFTEKQTESLKKMPFIESHVAKSKDGKYLVHKTTITHIKPIQYYEAVLEGQPEELA
jgi:hypothetical protein